MAVGDGHRCVISRDADTEIFEASLFLTRDEASHEPILLDHDKACVDDCRIVAVAVDTDKRHRTVG